MKLKLFILLSSLILTVAFTGCEVTTEEEVLPDFDSDWYYTGLDTKKESEGAKTIPMDLSFATLSGNTVELPSAVDLLDFMPPIGNQGSFGTCTAWATAYYARTIMSARENNLNASQLSDPQNIYSPLDMFLSTPSHGANCSGSNIYLAFQAMQKRGVANMKTVPYENLGNCSQSSGATTQQCEPGKIEHYRRVDVKNIQEIKAFIQRGCPIVVGCNMGPNAMSGMNGEVIISDVPDHSKGHAMCVVGYDDEKGPNGALRIVNSWGARYGDKGYMWVDYNFFVNSEFCDMGYAIEADKGTPPLIDGNVINPSMRVDGKDLLAINLEDRKGDINPGPYSRSVQYNVFNKGNQTINASEDWNIIYYYYNAYDPENDFGIIFYDYYTDDVAGEAAKGTYGDFKDLNTKPMKYGQQNAWNYVDVPAGFSVGRALDNGSESDMVFDYTLSDQLNGEYYFVLYADGFNSLAEKHEQNNFMFFTGKDRKPVKIENGIIQAASLKSAGGSIEPSVYVNELKQDKPNAYSLEEIAGLIQHQKENGILKKAASQYQQSRLKSGTVGQNTKRLVPSKK